MKINKKACREYEDYQFRFNKNNGLLYLEDKRYVVRSLVQNISGSRILLLFFYLLTEIKEDKARAKYIVFQAKDEYVTLERTEEGKYKWRSTRTRLLDGWYAPIIRNSAFYTHRDETRVITFCKCMDATGFEALSKLQTDISSKRRSKKMRETERKNKKRMQKVRPLPEKKIQSWLLKEVIPAHIFYQYQKGKKVQEGYCTHCHSRVLLQSPRHNKEYVCPSCGWKATCHATSRLSRVSNEASIIYMQRQGEDILVRVCKTQVIQQYGMQPIVWKRESSRAFLSLQGKTITCQEYYNTYKIGCICAWRKGKRPTYNSKSLEYEADTYGHLYTKNLSEILNGTDWEYSQLGELYLGDRLPVEVYSYFSAYLKYPVLEYLVKLKLYNLARFAVFRKSNPKLKAIPINMKGKNLTDVLGVDKKYLPMIQEMNISGEEFRLMKNLIQEKVSVDKQLLLWCQENNIFSDEDLKVCLRYTSIHKMLRYIREQCENFTQIRWYYAVDTNEKFVFGIYKDYIKFCEDLEYDLTDDFIVFPRNLKEAHDRAADMFDKKKVKIYNKKIAAQYDALAEQYQMEKFGFLIRPPKSATEIIKEGNSLHHCVGGYVSRIAKAETTVVFLRKTDDLKTPFYTLEVKDGEVLQIHGDNHREPTSEVQKFVQVWEKEKLRAGKVMKHSA